MINKNFLLCNLTLFTNFNPFFLKNFKINFKIKKKNKIFCKNFIFFLILLKYFQNKSKFFYSSVFIKPKKKKLLTILRPPYKNKLSRHQLVNTRFFLNFKLKIPLKIKIDVNKNLLKKYIYFFNKFLFFFETNLIYQHKTKFIFNFKNKNNFIIN